MKKGTYHMLNSNGFNVWAESYDKSVRVSDESDTYPFAGYAAIFQEICHRVQSCAGKTVLDIGFGTATLTSKLYDQGYQIYGQDFSGEMIKQAQKKMPQARLYQGDFSHGLVPELKQLTYDAVIATYSLHHLTDTQKVRFLNDLLPLLKENGCVYIGDVAFATRDEWEACKAKAGDGWDETECYFVYDELKNFFPALQFEPMSSCAGLFTLKKT